LTILRKAKMARRSKISAHLISLELMMGLHHG
jgi:hypothetical protein